MPHDRRAFLRIMSLAVAGGALPVRPLLAGSWRGLALNFQELRRGTGIFTARGGTMGWYISGDGLVVVDSQFADTAEQFLGGLRERSTRQIDALINTHHHNDHTGGNAVIRPAARTIVAHQRVPELLRRAAPEVADAAIPDRTFADEWREGIGDETVRARYYGPAHTSGDAVVFFENANVAHMGDLIFNHLHPFVDVASGASVQGWMNLLERVAADHDDETIFIFGHAGQGRDMTGPRQTILHHRDYFAAVLEHVEASIRTGRSRDEVAATESIRGFENFSGMGALLSLSAVLGATYDELSG